MQRLLGEPASVELVAVDGVVAGRIEAVPVTTLREKLRSMADLELLQLLGSDEHGLAKTFEASQCVLVSYRQERPAEPYSALTLDGTALRGILAAATTFGAEAIWLDAWCYRNGPEGYDHDDFCSTLQSVLAGVAGVVWLPQTNVGSRGDYPYRLWCTFEAASVRWRGTRVHIAGAGLSAFQRKVRALGSFVAAVHADGTLDRLARLNLAAYFWFAAQGLFSIVGAALGFLDAVAFSEHLSAVLFIGVLWSAGRASLAREVRLAMNARTVLRNMTAAASRRPCHPAAPDRGAGEAVRHAPTGWA